MNWAKYLIGTIIGALAAGHATMTDCGHSVDVTREQTTICKDGSCLVQEPGHISYSQAPPETKVQPIEQKKGK